MQTKPNNHLLLESREYKLILRSNNFVDNEKGTVQIVDKLKDHFDKQKGKFKVNESKAEKKKVWYLDTARHELNKKYNFLLRIREKYDKSNNVKGYDITFKNRDSDRSKASSFDLSGFKDTMNFKFKESKFEEDIVIPFESKFSVSTKFESKEYPNFDTYKNIENLFPHLDLDIFLNEELSIVNGFVVDEITFDLGSVEFHDAMDGYIQLGIWYDTNKSPLIAELDIDVKSKDLSAEFTNSEEFPTPKINKIISFTEYFKKKMVLLI